MADRTERLRKRLDADPFDIPTRLALIEMLEQSGDYAAAQLQRILMEPDDDEHRKAFAELCSSSSSPHDRRFGKFIERQLEFARDLLPDCYMAHRRAQELSRLSKLERGSPLTTDIVEQRVTRDRASYIRKFEEYRRHLEKTAESNLFAILDCGRPGKQPGLYSVMRMAGSFDHDICIGNRNIRFMIGRGFPHKLVVAWGIWLSRADLIMRRHPIQSVKITGFPVENERAALMKTNPIDRYSAVGYADCPLPDRLFSCFTGHEHGFRHFVPSLELDDLIERGFKKAWPQVKMWEIE